MHEIDKHALEAAWDVLDGVLDRSGEMCPFCCSDIADAIRAYEDALWRPIETLPGDQEFFLVHSPTAPMHAIQALNKDAKKELICKGFTHWRPLPNPLGGQEK